MRSSLRRPPGVSASSGYRALRHDELYTHRVSGGKRMHFAEPSVRRAWGIRLFATRQTIYLIRLIMMFHIRVSRNLSTIRTVNLFHFFSSVCFSDKCKRALGIIFIGGWYFYIWQNPMLLFRLSRFSPVATGRCIKFFERCAIHLQLEGRRRKEKKLTRKLAAGFRNLHTLSMHVCMCLYISIF